MKCAGTSRDNNQQRRHHRGRSRFRSGSFEGHDAVCACVMSLFATFFLLNPPLLSQVLAVAGAPRYGSHLA